MPPILPNDALFVLDIANDDGALHVPLLFDIPPTALLLPVRNICGTGISCDRNVRFELCIFTANDSDVRSGGNGVNNVRRDIVNEHNLKLNGNKMNINLVTFFLTRVLDSKMKC